MSRALPWGLAALIWLAGTGAAAQRDTAVLIDAVEGSVASVGRSVAEGGLEVVAVRLEGVATEYLLGPAEALEQAGLDVQVGDRLRLRFFEPGPDGRAAVSKVLNVTRSRMLRLRTLHRDPLWDDRGHWQGGPQGPGRGPGPHRPGRGGR